VQLESCALYEKKKQQQTLDVCLSDDNLQRIVSGFFCAIVVVFLSFVIIVSDAGWGKLLQSYTLFRKKRKVMCTLMGIRVIPSQFLALSRRTVPLSTLQNEKKHPNKPSYAV
jgi:hypothetical protein